MTQAEYIRNYRLAHAKNGRLVVRTQKELQKVFQEAAKLASDQVRKTTAAGLSDLTSTAWEQINRQLLLGADLIAEATEEVIPIRIGEAYQNLLNVDTKYIMDAVDVAGVSEITRKGIQNMGIAVNINLLNIQANRIYSDGYTFSDRVWSPITYLAKDEITQLPTSVHGDYQFRMKNLILTGQAQGRDVIDIAEDLDEYVIKGKDYVFKPARYGKLVPGTGQYKKRITKRIDWRALRLIRSEMNNSLQEAGIEEGILNPAATGLYDWVKTIGNPIDEDGSRNSSGLRCIDLDRLSPYTESEIPSYQHSNCSCSVRPRLMNQKDFVSDLASWVPGRGPEYLDKWYTEQYLPAQ